MFKLEKINRDVSISKEYDTTNFNGDNFNMIGNEDEAKLLFDFNFQDIKDEITTYSVYATFSISGGSPIPNEEDVYCYPLLEEYNQDTVTWISKDTDSNWTTEGGHYDSNNRLPVKMYNNSLQVDLTNYVNSTVEVNHYGFVIFVENEATFVASTKNPYIFNPRLILYADSYVVETPTHGNLDEVNYTDHIKVNFNMPKNVLNRGEYLFAQMNVFRTTKTIDFGNLLDRRYSPNLYYKIVHLVSNSSFMVKEFSNWHRIPFKKNFHVLNFSTENFTVGEYEVFIYYKDQDTQFIVDKFKFFVK